MKDHPFNPYHFAVEAILLIGTILALTRWSWENFFVFFACWFLTFVVGMEVTLHRMLSHRSFSTPRWFERVLSVLSILSYQGDPISWATHHRIHHAHSDTPKDPHNRSRGFWYAYLGWIFRPDPILYDQKLFRKYAPELAEDPFYKKLANPWIQRIIHFSFALPLFLLGGIDYLLWGVFARVFWSNHLTYMINSICHGTGYRNFETSDRSSNNIWIGYLTLGVGFHNNHHAQPNAINISHRAWEFDAAYLVIRIFEFLGVANLQKKNNTCPRALAGENI